MWFLQGPKGELIYLKCNSTIVVGRNQGDIVLRDDKSVSRKHASVSVQSTRNELKSWCFVKDLESKYGSSIIRGDENIKVTKEGTVVHHNDTIKFGLQENDYVVSYIPIVVLVSSMNNIERLQSIVNDLDGCIVHEWTNKVTHLTTTKAILGKKITMALVNCIPIVGMDYWETVIKTVQNNSNWPKCTEYILPITENVIDNEKVSLAPNLDRKTLFNKLTFLFFSFSQFRIYKEIIQAAGGKALMFDASVHTDLTQFCSDEFIIVYYMIGSNQTEESILDSQRLKTGYEKIEELLRKRKRRMISDTEITLAVLHCSLKQNCNPKHNYKELLLEPRKNVSNENRKTDVIALDTQDLRPKSAYLPNSENMVAETNEFTSQKLGKSQEDTQWSTVSSATESHCASPGPSVISSIHDYSQESTGDIETDLANLNMYKKGSEKRFLEPFTFAPVKKAKLNSGSPLFPVLPKSRSQDRFSQNPQGSQKLQGFQDPPSSQNLQASQNSQMSSRSNIPLLFPQHLRQTNSQLRSKSSQSSTSSGLGNEAKSMPGRNIFDSWMEETRENENEKSKEKSRQSEKRNESNKEMEETELPTKKLEEKEKRANKLWIRSDESLLVDSGSEVKRRRLEAVNQLDSEATRKKTNKNKSIIISGEPEAKKKIIEARNDSNSEAFKVPVERNDKRKRDSGGGDSDSNNIVMQMKQKQKLDSFNQTSDTTNDENEYSIFVSGLIREEFHDSLLERTFGHKKFHKVYNSIPRTRVTLESMVLCGIEVPEN